MPQRMFMIKYAVSRVVIIFTVPLSGCAIGTYLDRLENERMTLFRDKSALYGRTLAPGEPPSWP